MLRSKSFVRGLMALGLIVAVAVPVSARFSDVIADCKAVVAKMDESKVPLGKAVEAAEAHAKGRAVLAMGAVTEGKLSYSVYCVVGDKLMNVTVDATGKVSASEEATELPLDDDGDDAPTGKKGDKAKPEKVEKEKPEKGDKKDKGKNGG
ncbi:MAG: hypothetical protein KJ057_03775 [Phycisphaerae bacterium]|nr:MAG: hypothetical protein F9K17_05825 [Phycisphaerae bacterium]MBE7457770.1 hypothetical protein [Planctomycetia bacterium]MCK6463711.1 hypothetical protein [Phycisphaerae bacterium]MCL4717574.1 hypothetical protein [Phycisphaerae bacterium]NUQ08407.1 hypothetical protein [Phycisphaerae bacterium]